MKLIIASNNKHKIKEIKAILGTRFEEIISIREAGIDHETVEDGTTFTSEGYAACYYLEDFGTVWGYLQKQAGKLIDKYEVPEKEVREIAAVLCYTYNGLDAASGENGYTFHYYSPLVYLTGQTAVPTAKLVDSDGSINFQRLENDWGDGYQEKFNPLIRELRKLSPEKLPEVIEPDPENVIFDGDTQYIVIYFADGTTVTSSGYCASEYNEQFAAVWALLERAQKSGMP